MRDSGHYSSHDSQPVLPAESSLQLLAALRHCVDGLDDRSQFVVLVGKPVAQIGAQPLQPRLNNREALLKAEAELQDKPDRKRGEEHDPGQQQALVQLAGAAEIEDPAQGPGRERAFALGQNRNQHHVVVVLGKTIRNATRPPTFFQGVQDLPMFQRGLAQCAPWLGIRRKAMTNDLLMPQVAPLDVGIRSQHLVRN